ncbi:MAG: class I SAM-dependent methyltransferase family protein, partial [bacterium]
MKKIERILLKLFIHTVGRQSKGISLCQKFGLTSGMTLDYIYQNSPSGSTILGKWIDKVFLSHVGWECIRVRKKQLQAYLESALNNSMSRLDEVHIVDIAAGPAQYI